ncbi:hypothetical protein PM082_006260 [Marasmius tenuissimus]|nr:hypothetical protein PM082_006260 [Marasmius tenuissimus]
MKGHRTRSQTAGELQCTRSQTTAHREARSQGTSSKGKSKAPASSTPAQSPAPPKVKARHSGIVSIRRVLKLHKKGKGDGIKKHGNRLDDYKDCVRWGVKTITFDVSYIGVLYTGINKYFQVEGVDMAGLPEDGDEQEECLKHFNALMECIGKNQLLKDLEEMLEHDLLKDMAEILNTSKKDSRAQDTRQLKDVSLEYLRLFLNIPAFNPPLSTHTPKGSRGTNHKQIARVLIPPELLAEFDEDPEAFLCKLENGQIVHTPHDLGLCLYENGVYNPEDPEEGLFRSLFLVLVWKFIYLGPEAAAMHGVKVIPGEELPTSRGQAAKHGLLEPTKETLTYAIVQGVHAIGLSSHWRKGQNSVLNTQLHRAVSNYFDDPHFEKSTLHWWRTEGLNGACIKPSKSQNLEDMDIDPKSMLGKTLQKREFRRQFVEASNAAKHIGAALRADIQDTTPESIEILETRLEQRRIALISTVKINRVSTDDDDLPSSSTDNNALPSSSTNDNLPPVSSTKETVTPSWPADDTDISSWAADHDTTILPPSTDDVDTRQPSRIIGSLIDSEHIEDPIEVPNQQDWDSDHDNFCPEDEAMAFDETQYVGGSTQTQKPTKKTSDADALTQAESVTEPETEEDVPVPPVVKKAPTSTTKKTYQRSAATIVINDSDAEDDNEAEEKPKPKPKSKGKGKGKEKADDDTGVKEKTKKRKRKDKDDDDTDVQGQPSLKLPKVRKLFLLSILYTLPKLCAFCIMYRMYNSGYIL